MNTATIETFHLAITLLPGFCWSLIWMKYSKNKPQTDKFYFIIYAVIASVLSYLILFLIIGFRDFSDNNIFKLIDGGQNSLGIIFISTLISIVGAFICVFFSHKTPVLKLMQKFKLSLSDGEIDVLVSVMHTHMRLGERALIRLYDFSNNRIYQGLITQISEPREQMEFIIANCDIYENNTGKFLLNMSRLYLNINSKNLLIEIL